MDMMANSEPMDELPPFLKCAQCEAPLREHSFLDVGSAIPRSQERDIIDDLVKRCCWDRLPFPTEKTQADSLIVFRATRCPSGRGFLMALAFSRAPVDDDRLDGAVQRLSETEIDSIGSILGPWKPPTLRDLA